MGFILKFILIILIIFWIFRLIINYFARSFMKNLNNNGQNDYTQTKRKKEGDIHIEKKPAQNKKIKKDVGEYIDYEDVD